MLTSRALDYQYLTETEDARKALLGLLQAQHKVVALDTETGGLDPIKDALITIQLYQQDGPPLIFDMRALGGSLNDLWRRLLANGTWLVIGHNLVFDARFILAHLGVSMGRVYDTYLAERVLTAGLLGERASLEAVALRYLDIKLDKQYQMAWPNLAPDARPTDEMLRYAADDVTLIERIMRLQIARLVEEGLLPTAKLEMAVLPASAEATVWGVAVDRERWVEHIAALSVVCEERGRALVEEMQPFVEAWRAKLYGQAAVEYAPAYAEWLAASAHRQARAEAFRDRLRADGFRPGDALKLLNDWKRQNPTPTKPTRPPMGDGEINLQSGDQLGGALVMMGLPVQSNDKGNFVLDKFALSDLAESYEIVNDIRQYRELSKLISSFGNNIVQKIDANGRLHPEFRQYGADTGRFSCSNPNVQQMPNTADGATFRRCFRAGAGNLLYDADYSQIELRILAFMADEENMKAAFRAGYDLHSTTALRMFPSVQKAVGLGSFADFEALAHDERVKILALVAERCGRERKVAKAINFGIAYGLTPAGLARNIKIPLIEAQEYVESYYKANPRVQEWKHRVEAEGLGQGYVRTPLGRKRYFAPLGPRPRDWKSDEALLWNRRERAYRRRMTNHVIQGCSADITKLAIIYLRKEFATVAPEGRPRMLMFVHDEILVEGPADLAGYIETQMRAHMLRAAARFLGDLPVDVGFQSGALWEH